MTISRRILNTKSKILFVSFLLTSNLFGQKSSPDVYAEALSYYCNNLDSSCALTKEIFVDGEGVSDLPNSIGLHRVTIVSEKNRKGILKAHNNKIKLIRILPTYVKDGLIEIYLSPQIAEYKGKNEYYYSILGGRIVIQFFYDCDNRQFRLLTTNKN